ncbi:glycosyltransferase 87 family protein [Glaciihabitans sp. UYNi722]|uniref:glycosyltransferase 87 family protein n=1 Tax=Glaciihabitans sp. UYNi722 TaxID=3156344 RepID=UPI003390ECF7
MRIAVASVFVVAMAALTWYSVTALGYFDRTHPTALLLCTAGLWALFALAFLALRRVPVKVAIAMILAGSALIGGAAMAGPPNTSTDSARYAWDGIVQNAGISPYRYVPVDDHLAELRPDWLFPAAVENADGTHRCLPARTDVTSSEPSHEVFCSALNRSKVPTIYPPTSEIFFAAVRFVVGPDAEYWPLQLAGLLMSLGITVMLIVAMRRRGIDPRWAALWAWSPLVATEAITNSHVDVLGALLVVVASLLVSRGIRFRGGIALGAAIAAKLIPVIAAPALLRRQPWKVIVAAIVTFAVLYIPYVITTGIGVLGYLPGYLSEEGYDNGSRFTLLTLFVPKAASLAVAALLLLVTAVLVWWKTDPTSPWLGQVIMIGTTLLIVSPRYPWYALLLVPFIALSGRWEWFAVPLALTVRLLIPSHGVSQVAISIAIVIIVGMALYRTGPHGRTRLMRPIRRAFRRSPV